MSLSISQWHLRYLQQARWTQALRSYTYGKCGIRQAQRILEVGCGTGVLEDELAAQTAGGDVVGIDNNYTAIQWARNYALRSCYAAADCLSLPFSSTTFDITLCHFLLLWIPQLDNALSEMARVTRSGGYVVALAEPDYGGRIDFPIELADIGKWQIEALKQQGVDPYIGRKLRSLFSRHGLLEVEAGVLGGQWLNQLSEQEIELEWQVLVSDLEKNQNFLDQVKKYKSLEYSSQIEQTRILYVPVFYTLGKVP